MSEMLINIATQHGGGVQYTNSASFGLSYIVKRFLNFKESFKKVFAFTLAETLIVIGIIGVVASLTIPNLTSSTADREKVTKVKKTYATLTEAFARAQAVYGPMEEWFNDSMDDNTKLNRLGSRVVEFMKLSKDCQLTQQNTCFGSGNPSASFEVARDFTGGFYRVLLSDGTSVGFGLDNDVYFDIDGPNKGNAIHGKDLFMAELDTKTGELSYDTASSYNNPDLWKDGGLLTSCRGGGGWTYCLGWVMSYGNFDYLKTSDGSKCNDSNIVLDGKTNTSCR